MAIKGKKQEARGGVWWLNFIVNLTGFGITMDIYLSVYVLSNMRVFSVEGRPSLKAGGAFAWAGIPDWTQRKKSKQSTSTHGSSRPDYGYNVTTAPHSSHHTVPLNCQSEQNFLKLLLSNFMEYKTQSIHSFIPSFIQHMLPKRLSLLQ